MAQGAAIVGRPALAFLVRSPTTKASHDKLAGINAHGFAVLAVSFMPELSQKRHDAELLKAAPMQRSP